MKCPETLNLLFDIIDSRPSGIPIGNYTSQFFGNLYLSPLDHYIKEELRIKFFERYMDDMIILSDSKEYLHYVLGKIQQFLQDKLLLQLKGNYQIFDIEVRGINFVGYVTYHNYSLLRTSTVRRLKKATSHIRKRLNTGKQLTLSNLCTIGSYKGILEHGNCFHLAQATIGGFDNEISKRNSNRTAS